MPTFTVTLQGIFKDIREYEADNAQDAETMAREILHKEILDRVYDSEVFTATVEEELE